MTTYETVFITLPSLTDEEESDLVSSLAQIVTDDGGTLVANERMGRRRLAYPIRKSEDGVYTRFLYDASPVVPKELDRRIRLSDKVLRHLTVRLEADWAAAAKQQAVRDAEAREQAARAAAEEARQKAEAAEIATESPPEPEAPHESPATSTAAPADAHRAPANEAPTESEEPPAKRKDEDADA